MSRIRVCIRHRIRQKKARLNPASGRPLRMANWPVVLKSDVHCCWRCAGSSAGSSAVATSWTCSTSGVSYTLVCQGCPEADSTITRTSSGLSKGQIQTICIVIGCMVLHFQAHAVYATLYQPCMSTPLCSMEAFVLLPVNVVWLSVL